LLCCLGFLDDDADDEEEAGRIVARQPDFHTWG
jgi:hypothetical protein